MSAEPDAGTQRIAVVTDDEALGQLVREVLATMLPAAVSESVAIDRASVSSADVMVVDADVGGREGANALKEIRAGGYQGPVVLVARAGAELAPAERELRRVQQLIAMGEATGRIQHTLNNPLTALLAEAQLLEMEELADDHRAAVRRIIELCRRLVGMVRTLDPGTR